MNGGDGACEGESVGSRTGDYIGVDNIVYVCLDEDILIGIDYRFVVDGAFDCLIDTIVYA